MQLSNCKMSLAEYARYFCTGQLPDNVLKIFAGDEKFLKDLICMASLIGALEPLSATRPNAGDPVIFYERQVTIAPADIDGVPREEQVAQFCAPMNRAMMIAESRLSPANAAASQQPVPQPIYKKVNLGAFGENWCMPFEPSSKPGSFVNIEHILVPPGAGFAIYAQNYSTTEEAIYNYKARMWISC
jgi:hypothetical protein